MAKRIVKETLGDGRVLYRVETNRLFGFIPIKWTTDIDFLTTGLFCDNGFPAVFENLSDAESFCGIIPNSDKVIKKEIL